MVAGSSMQLCPCVLFEAKDGAVAAVEVVGDDVGIPGGVGFTADYYLPERPTETATE